MADKSVSKASESSPQTGQNAVQAQQQQQVPPMWNPYMYNMYGMYNMYQNYNHPYYQFVAGTAGGGYGNTPVGSPAAANTAVGFPQGVNQQQQQQVANQQQGGTSMMAMEAYRNSFTSGGTLTSFTPPGSTAAQSPDTKIQTSKTATMALNSSIGETKVEEIELPPLPPGPPPPVVPPPPPPGPAPSPPPPPPSEPPPSTVQQTTTPTYPQYIGFNNQQPYQQLNKPYQPNQFQQPNQQNQYQKNQHKQFQQNQQKQFQQNQQNQYQQNQQFQPNQFQPAPNQQNQFQQSPQQNQFQQNQPLYNQNQPLYPAQQNSNNNQFGQQKQQNQNQNQGHHTRWGAGENKEKESRWSQPNQPQIRFNTPNQNRNNNTNNNNNNRFNNQPHNNQDGPIRFNMNRPRARLNANKGSLLPTPEWSGTSPKNKWGGAKGQAEDRVAKSSVAAEKPNTLSDEETLRKLVDGWPAPLKCYVDRCFSECPPNKKDKLVIVLKSQLIKAAENGSLWCKHWELEPLPELQDDVEITPKKKSLESRLGYNESQTKSPSKKKKKDRRSRGRSSSSESSNSSQESYIGFSTSKKKSKNKDKKKNKYKHNLDESHYWSEFGMTNGGKVETKREVLDKRAARFNVEKAGGGNNSNKSKAKISANTRMGGGGSMSDRLRLPQGGYTGGGNATNSSPISFTMDVDTEFDLSSCHIVGTCRDIEKPYLRLTTAPEACQVRPPEVLKDSLDNAKEKWVETQDYRYVCEQLKSIRQDLTVQGIRDGFTVLVYETHARIALEKGDHAEFNQCQSQLVILHGEHNSMNKYEFTAYRLLYFIFTQDFNDVNQMLMNLDAEEKKNVCIQHSLNVMKAWLASNYDRLFKLYRTCPRMSSYLMDWFMPRERKNALKIIVKSYRPTVPTEFLIGRLAFDSETKLMDFLEPLGVIYSDPMKKTVDCKSSTAALCA